MSFIIFMALLLVFFSPAMAQSAPARPASTINVNILQANLLELLDALKEQTGYEFFFDRVAAKKIKIQNFRLTSSSIQSALKKMRKDLPLDYHMIRNEITIQIESDQEFTNRIKKEQPGKLSGKVFDDKGGTLPGANIRVIGANYATQCTADGTYQLNLPAGTYTIEVSYISFKTKRITDIIVKPGQNTPLDILLTVDSKSLNEVVVTASYRRASIEGLYAKQKNNSAMSDGITAEQISRTPATNTAQVLAKISGLQISNDRNVVVRGLSDRYNNVLLNGAMLPSSEPNRRDFAFDMIPSALVDNVIVNKTATPDLTGEFTGGLVQVNTKDIPAEDFFQITVGSGYNTRATGKNTLGLDRGNHAWLGLGSDIHRKPGGLSFGEYNAVISSVKNGMPTADQRTKINSFLGSVPENWRFKQYTGEPIQNYQLQGGKVLSFKNDSRLGIIGALTYRNEQRADQRDMYFNSAYDYQGDQYRYITTLGGSLNLGYSFGKNKITLQNTYNGKFSDDFWKYKGVDFDNNNTRVDNYNNVTVINNLLQSQLSGEHTLTKSRIKVDWNFSAARLNRDQPYSRILTRGNGTLGDNTPEDYFGYDLSDPRIKNGSLYYSELNEKLYNWGTNIQIPFNFLKLNQTFKTGYQGKYRESDFNANLYRMFSFNKGTNFYNGLPYYDVFNTANFTDDLYLRPIGTGGATYGATASSEGYDGFQRLHAFYGMLDIKPLQRLRLIGGIRAERNTQTVFDRVLNEGATEVNRVATGINQTDWLPSVNAIYSLTSKFNIRAAVYKTVARPDLRELSAFQYFDYEIYDVISGAPLKTTHINNADLRLEYFPSPGEIVSISGFYKKFKNPIEVVYIGTSSGQTLFYNNLLSAKDLGVEFDFRKSLNFWGSESPIWKNIYVSGNFTWLDASIDFDPQVAVDTKGNPVSTKRNRPLAGQSPYIINGGLLYTGTHFGLNVTYNRYGKRIVYASPNRSLDQYENPRDMMDAQLSYKFLKQQKAEFRLNISNLLNQEQFIYTNRFNNDNSLGANSGDASIEEYPDTGGQEPIPANRIDPKGTNYNKDYDTKFRRFRFGTTFTLNFIYRF
ncbi:TonB-dependent receptor [Mucilaginibacter sp. Bleaf8]|uniref:TonB-dependent receptor n=1 Tax=Mucilaginibacter sp. Bleaf8 TaxID=2834430 RepID=UPI001BCD2234|nr:TonB-dependent receptor [Mucilaginibacter sp. Bleaf8]MBS7566953.1 TonB-dependent receptor [Mucilaginibacter sp. Bleaf8]